MKTNVIPTRLVLAAQKKRLATARHGHHLLKDKRDELVRQFMLEAKKTEELRARVEEKLSNAFSSLALACAVMTPQMYEEALCYPSQHVEVECTEKNIMSVHVPQYRFKTEKFGKQVGYGLALTPAAMDDAVNHLADVFDEMLALAQSEKVIHMLAEEIEATRRRVNALEYVLIPETEETIRYISMKLAEEENATKVRLIKVKEMVFEKAHREKV